MSEEPEFNPKIALVQHGASVIYSMREIHEELNEYPARYPSWLETFDDAYILVRSQYRAYRD